MQNIPNPFDWNNLKFSFVHGENPQYRGVLIERINDNALIQNTSVIIRQTWLERKTVWAPATLQLPNLLYWGDLNYWHGFMPTLINITRYFDGFWHDPSPWLSEAQQSEKLLTFPINLSP